MGLMQKVFGDLNSKEVKKLEKIADKVMALEPQMEGLTDEELRAKTGKFKERLKAGETLDDLLPEAFAVCREGAWRSVGLKHFKVQVIGGIALHQGRISEMKTGEGKDVYKRQEHHAASRRDATADLSEDGQLCLRILEFKFKIYHRKLFSY